MTRREISRKHVNDIVIGKKYLYRGNGTIHNINYDAEVLDKTPYIILLNILPAEGELTSTFGPAQEHKKCITINGLGIDEHLYELY